MCVTLCGEAQEEFVSLERFDSWSQVVSQQRLSLHPRQVVHLRHTDHGSVIGADLIKLCLSYLSELYLIAFHLLFLLCLSVAVFHLDLAALLHRLLLIHLTLFLFLFVVRPSTPMTCEVQETL